LAAGVGAVLLATTLGAIPATRALPTHLDDRRLALYEAGIQRRWLGAPMHKANETEFFQVETCNSAAIGESDPSFNEVRAPWLYGNDRPKPPAYWFWRAGIGTIDWDDQGWTVRAAARPRFWRMPGDCGGDDQTPRLLPNAAYRGEAYTAPGWQAELCTTRISVDWLRTMVEADGWVVVVFNQNAVGRWRTSLGTYERTPDDLVAVRLTLHGIHRLSLVYLAAELKFFWVTFIALLFLLTPASDPLFVAVGRRQRE
jgi:hypothetical protein